MAENDEKESSLGWYVVRAIAGQERKIKAYLEKEIEKRKLHDFIKQILIPSEKVLQIRKTKDGKSKKVAVEKNFFPGYIIMQLDLQNGEIPHLIKSVPGVIGFLNTDTKDRTILPKPMRESEVNRLLGKVEDTDQYEIKHDIRFNIGEQVKVLDGPFNGFLGTVEEVFEERKKLNVMVKIFGRNAPVELNYSQVEKVE
ncbi:MAG: transcription termination/antitermination protein NusG [Cytophagales bacterium]|nr:transcription termination/antitermination protein NusG [Cytophagales bacterium]MDW8383739.1 transcription termination/antitermination protein NusG [Flammeovirgaceae bacterium]